jgi:hypothetical protein
MSWRQYPQISSVVTYWYIITPQPSCGLLGCGLLNLTVHSRHCRSSGILLNVLYWVRLVEDLCWYCAFQIMSWQHGHTGNWRIHGTGEDKGSVKAKPSVKRGRLWAGSNFDESSWKFSLTAIISSQLSSTLMQLLFSLDQGMRVEKTLIQTLASQLSCKSLSRLTGVWRLRKLSYKLSLLNSHATLVFVWLGHEGWENSQTNSRFSTLMHATLVLVWLGYEGWENSHANSRFSTLINSHATLVLVWPQYESWENSRANSRFSTLMQVLFSFDRGMRLRNLILVWQGA